jgi:hypothetical protein
MIAWVVKRHSRILVRHAMREAVVRRRLTRAAVIGPLSVAAAFVVGFVTSDLTTGIGCALVTAAILAVAIVLAVRSA